MSATDDVTAVDAARTLVRASEFHQAITVLKDDATEQGQELLGYSHTMLRHYRLAEFHYQRALDIGPTTLSAAIGLSDSLIYQFRTDEAAAVLARIKADTLSPIQRAWLLAAKGNVSAHAFVVESAIQFYLEAVAILPDMWTSWLSLGHCYAEQRRMDLAEGAYLKAMALSKNFHTKYHLGVHYFLTGRYREGLELMEERIKEPKLGHQALSYPMWKGEKVKRLAVFHEGGLGDLTLFARYIYPASKLCEELIFVVPEKVEEWVACMDFPENVRLVPKVTHDGLDVRASLMSLPLLLDRCSPAEAPSPVYTTFETKATFARPQIALTWFGDQTFPNGIARDIPLEKLSTLVLSHPEADFFTVSCEAKAQEDIERTGLPIEIRKGHLQLAAQELTDADLLISVDSAHAHIAGSCGTPVWMLVAYLPGLYWGMDGSDTPYYPQHRLFRQHAPRDWTRPLALVASELDGFLAILKGRR